MLYNIKDFENIETREEIQKELLEYSENKIYFLSFGDLINQFDELLFDPIYDDGLTCKDIDDMLETEKPYKRSGHYSIIYKGVDLTIY